MRPVPPLAAVLLASLLLAGCSGTDGPGDDPLPSPGEQLHTPSTPHGATPSDRSSDTPGTEGEASPASGPLRPRHLDVRVASSAVQHLAGEIGPRHATSPAHRRAARWVAGQLRAAGHEVRLERFGVPGGVSWGEPVRPGRSVNVVAVPAGFDPTSPHLLVGAHLDTVPQAPGAEDNASGVGVLLAVARAVSQRETRLPVVLVAFGAEEPRGPGDDDHHYGSRHHVSELSPAARRSLRGMVSLDRVGVGPVLPVCSAGQPDRWRAELLAAASRAQVRVDRCTDNRASDHWSFVRAGLPGARLGSTSYAGYHSPQDVPAVVSADQLSRAGRTVLAWLAPREG